MIVLLILLLLSFFSIQIAFANSTSNCINFNSSKRSIEISCESANLTDIDNQLNNMNILEKQSGTTHHNNNEIWLLKANLIVAKWATFSINSTDTKWLKIYFTQKTAYHIDIYGSVNIDSVKITSWNPKNKTVDKFSNSEPHSRSSIRIAKEATGTTNITNSELAYLGGGASHSTLNIKNSKFYSDIKVKSDHGNNTVNIFNSGIIEVTDNKSTRTYDTDILPFSTKISNEIFIRFIFRDSL